MQDTQLSEAILVSFTLFRDDETRDPSAHHSCDPLSCMDSAVENNGRLDALA